jgi:hypothetical protein
MRRGAFPGARKPRSYAAKSITLTGPDGVEHRFASRAEAAYVVSLWLDPEARVVELQPRYDIHVPGRLGGIPVKVGSYRADVAWIHVPTDTLHVDDVKGWMAEGTRDAVQLRLRCVAAEHGIEVRLVKPMTPKAVDRAIALWTAGLCRRAA